MAETTPTTVEIVVLFFLYAAPVLSLFAILAGIAEALDRRERRRLRQRSRERRELDDALDEVLYRSLLRS